MTNSYYHPHETITKELLFILKRKEDFNPIQDNKIGLSTGLFNSASFVSDMCNDIGIKSNVEIAIDNNCIDKLVTLHKPTHVIIEALWVVPSKFEVLTRLHPDVKWIIRLHSETPFIAMEGIAMNWLADYLSYSNVSIVCNAPRILDEIKVYLSTVHPNIDIDDRIGYLPNYYPQTYKKKTSIKTSTTLISRVLVQYVH